MNTLTEEQVMALLEGKRVLGPVKDIQEAQNALEGYQKLDTFSPEKEADFLEAHHILMEKDSLT